MRGFGSGLAAKGTRNKAQLEKINILANEINQLNIVLQEQMKALRLKYPHQFKANISQQLKDLDDTSNSYVSFAQNKFKNDITNNKVLLEDSKGWI